MSYRIRLIEKKEIAKDATCFVFEKPKGFKYKAGQCADFTLPLPKGLESQNLTRTFTLSSAPHEKTIYIVTKNTQSDFKKLLFSFRVGQRVKLEGPFGTFFLRETLSKPLVFIGAGIGVTPFASILKEAFFKNEDRNIIFMYSYRHDTSAVFLDDFLSYAKQHKNFSFTALQTAKSSTKKTIKPRLDKKFLMSFIKNPGEQSFYISGPIPFIVRIREILLELNISDENIRTDEFTGYSE
ncbi:MAG: FAD-dependent oxidoreductase [Patescibacteria group bacterium]